VHLRLRNDSPSFHPVHSLTRAFGPRVLHHAKGRGQRQFLDDQRQRNAVEGKIGQGKRRFGLGLIREKLAITQGSTIALNVLAMNLEKLLALLFVLFTASLRLLLGNEAGRSIRTVHPKPQIATA